MKKFTQWLLLALAALVALPSAAQTFVGDRSDFRDETIYFAMTTRFYDGDPTNNVCSWDKQDVQISKNDPDWRGDFAGLIEKLDYIKALGFTAIWITPVVQNASGEDYHGYHAMDFSSVDLRYESRTQWGAAHDVKFEDLIKAAHDKKMKIILDVVLQHTGNFGEATLNPLFKRDQNIKNQASVSASLIVNTDRLSSNYFEQSGENQYKERWKYFKQAQYEPNNYYHHYGTGWNWDLPNRWWGQIAGDCVDLNTENNYVAEYIVKCYGEFIKMGVDGFRIDTTGHIAPLTFNKQFIPQFHKIANEYKHKRLNECEFFMFGECCQRFQGSVVYRDQPNLSSYFYTWKSDQSLLNEYNGDPAWWRAQTLNEGHDTPVGPMAVCEKDTKDKPTSNNALMVNGAWHEPDYSQYSGFSVIDFPMHYAFNNAGSAVSIARSGDNKYNDASWNVVYVDSHDYCPGPNDGTRFNGGTEQWAENLSLMFSFRGIPCIYYGSEVEFKKGLPIDVGGENNKTPRSQSGRAYFGEYIKGSVDVEDFGKFSNAQGNMAKTLNADLSQHIIRLNQIRAAVPALRKGQYTFDGCSANGGHAFKRAYKDSYALVALNGGATFTGVPAGNYVDLVTGQSYTPSNGTITVSAPSNKGQLRVLVKGWTGGKVGTDGKFIYASSPVAHGGSVTFEDPGTTQYYTKEDAVDKAAVSFSPAGGTFKTETLNVTASLNESAVSGWYQIEGQGRVTLTPGATKSFTVGQGMQFGQSIKVTWGAKGETGDELNGTVTYKKVDPNATITVYVKAPGSFNLYAWGKDASGTEVKPCGAWPGKAMSQKTNINGTDYYYHTFDDLESVNVIFNNNGQQTADISGIDADTFFEYDGGTQAKKIDVNVTPEVTVKMNPNGGEFVDKVNVTITASNATSAWYKIGNGNQVSFNNNATFTLGESMNAGESVTVSWSATDGTKTKTGSATFKKVEKPTEPEGITVYVKSSSSFNMYAWGTNSAGANVEPCGAWPGKQITDTKVINGTTYKYFTFTDMEAVNVIFNNGSAKTADIEGITSDKFFEYDGNTGYKEIQENVTPTLAVKINPNGGEFVDKVNVTITASNATSAWYKIGNGNQVSFNNNATFTLGNGMNAGESVTVSWSATDGTETKTGSATFKKVEQPVEPEGITVYYDNSQTNWGTVKVHYWGGESASTWPGVDMAKVEGNIWKYTVPTGTTGIVFNNGNGDQTNDVNNPIHNHVYKGTGNRGFSDLGEYNGGGDDPIPPVGDLPAELYIIGNLSVGSWTTNSGVKMTRSGNTFVAENVTFVAAPGESLCYFNLNETLGADWNAVNANNRYGASAEGEEIFSNSPATMVAYLKNVSAEGCLSWGVAPGVYKVIADFANMTVTVISGQTGIDGIYGDYDYSTTEYYNLQGVRVANPTPGLYIVRRGNTISKEIVR